MELELVDRRRHVRSAEQLVQMMRQMVADADGPRTPRSQDLLHRSPRLGHERWTGPVNEVQVDVASTQGSQAPVERGERRLEALIGVPQLRGHEQLLARDAALAQTLLRRHARCRTPQRCRRAGSRAERLLATSPSTSGPSSARYVPRPSRFMSTPGAISTLSASETSCGESGMWAPPPTSVPAEATATPERPVGLIRQQ